ncbi:MAG: methyltransferase [Acidobacteria bacterium]|nr:methyltransferase [Acidobacteriota bacterium]
MSLVLGDPESFRRLRENLHAWGFDEEGLAETPGPDDPRGLLARLFLQALPESVKRSTGLLGAEGLALLESLGLVKLEGDTVRASCLLYPLQGLHVASDFPGVDAPDDFVFPAISQQTWEFLGILWETPCESLLEVGTGSGAAALTATRYARRVYAGDVSPRCLHFAEFNRRLNAADSMEVRESDVYEGFPQLTFDRIIAHPPYVPWTGKQDVYRHGGPDGEAVLRRLLGGLAERLRPGGRLYAATMGLDTAEAPLEMRVRAMLGEREAEFDVLLVEREVLTPLEFLLPWQEGEGLTFEESWALSEALRERKTVALVRCSLIIARKADDSAPRTLRRKAGKLTDALAIQEALEEDSAPLWTSWEELLDLRPELQPGVTLETVSGPDEDEWSPRRRILDAQGPFSFRTDCPKWAAELLPRLDGDRSVREALADDPVDADEAEAFLNALLGAGVLSR